MSLLQPKRGIFLLFGAVIALIGVIVGAGASHALKPVLSPQQLDWIEIGHRYLVWHSLALIALDCLPTDLRAAKWRGFAGYLFLAGILLFTGSLWLMGLTGVTGLGIVTPFGGSTFIAGWICLILYAVGLVRQGEDLR